MKVYGVNAEVRAFIESRARKGDGDAQAALDELNRTNNGCEPQLAVMDGELCIGQMMSMFS